jgi:DNA polymerase family A
MTLLPFMTDIAVHANGQMLIIPDCLTDSEFETVKEHKAEILTRLRAHQMTPAGFLTCLPGALLGEIRALRWLVLDIETSSLTRYSEPTRVDKTTTIGPGTWTSYRAVHLDATINIKPRVRVITIHHKDLGTYSFDLDAMPAGQRQQLIDAVIRGKILIGHNLGFECSWLFAETDARPAFLLDTLLLVRHIRPGALLRLFGIAARGDEDTRTKAMAMIKSKGGRVNAKLDYVAACLGQPVPDKSYQAPQNWCITPLSSEHYEYACGDVHLPLYIVHFLLPEITVEAMVAAIKAQYSWYVPFAQATILLAESHVRGVPFDFAGANALKQELLVELRQAADDLMKFPEFAALSREAREALIDPLAGESQTMKQALAAHAELNGVQLPATDRGGISTDRKALMLCGAVKLPAWKQYDRLKACKKALSVIEDLKRAAAYDGRLHSLIGCGTNTSRMSSQEPNVQNVPSDPRFRALVKAEDGYVILTFDYNAIELRIGAALAERAIVDIMARLRGEVTGMNNSQEWFLKLVEFGYQAKSPLSYPAELPPDCSDKELIFAWLDQAIPAVAQIVLHRPEQMMASAFRRGIDPHLVTAIEMLRLIGHIDTGGLSSIDWLTAQDAATRKKLKKELELWRKKAKAVNFGLLYGMSIAGLWRYGVTDFKLDWTMEEAQQVYSAWFALYPELRLWQWWTKFIASRKVNQDAVLIWNSYAGELERPDYERRLFTPTTLAGRPFAILNEFKEALSYQDQGSGADILVLALTRLRSDVAAMMLMPVHDELIFHVPADKAGAIQLHILEAMVQAGDIVLDGLIPIVVEPVSGPTWMKP